MKSQFRFVELSISYHQPKEHPYMPELTLFLAYVRTDLCTDVRSDRPETRNIGGQTQKAEHHRHGDTLLLLVPVYRSE